MKDPREYKEREVSFERVILFTDAVVAIAITLLALDLRLESESETVTFHELLEPWKIYLAFTLSFINIAGFWRTHHSIFTYAHKMNDKLLALNIAWLFFIVTLPFSTSVLSSHLFETPAVFLYSLNIFILSVIQNFIWDYADAKAGFVSSEAATKEERHRMRIIFNVDMLNGLVAIVVSFINPLIAFILLFFKIPTFVLVTFFIGMQRRRQLRKMEHRKKREERRKE